MKRSELKEAIKNEIISVLSEEELEKFQMTYKGDPVHIKVQGFGGNAGGPKDKILFVNIGGMGKRHKSTQNALEKRLGLLDQEVTGIMFTDKDNTSKEIKDISKDDFEIKSVLSEEIQVGDIVTLGGDSDELEVIDSRRMFGSDMMAYRVKKADGTKFNANVDFPEIGDETVEYSGDKLRPARMMNEGKRGVVVDPDEIMMHINQYQSGNIDGDDLAQAIEEILVAMMSTPLNEDKEPTSADLKEDRRRVLSYDNRDDRTTELFLDNGDSVEVDVIELYDNLKENNPTFADIREEDEMSDDEKKKAAEKGAKKEKLGKQASKLSKEDEDRYDRIKNGLEKLKKKGDEESIKRMKAILAKKDVQKLIKAKGREESSFM